MEVVHAVFAFNGIPPAIVQSRMQAALHRFANPDVLLLHLI
jgi:hypothetical protein